MSFLEKFENSENNLRLLLFNEYLDSAWRVMFDELREQRPILQVPIPNGGTLYVVSLWDHVIDVLRQHEVFRVRPYRRAMDPSVGPFMLARDGACPIRDEKPKMLSVLSVYDEPVIRAIASRTAIKALSKTREKVDIVRTLSRLVPLRVVQEYFGFPGDDTQMLAWSRATQQDMFRNPDPSYQSPWGAHARAIHQRNLAAGHAMQSSVRLLLEKKFRGPDSAQTDAVSRLVRLAKSDSSFMGFERLVTNVCGLLVGAVETSSQAIVQVVYELLDPNKEKANAKAKQAAASEDPSALAPFVWEALRFNPIAPLVARQCAVDARLPVTPENDGDDDHVTIPKGALVAVGIGSAMFDETRFPNAADFLTEPPARQRENYLHFGYHHHECLGRSAGEAIVVEAVRQILLLPGLAPLRGPANKIDYGPKIGPRRGPFPEKYEVRVT